MLLICCYCSTFPQVGCCLFFLGTPGGVDVEATDAEDYCVEIVLSRCTCNRSTVLGMIIRTEEILPMYVLISRATRSADRTIGL